MAAQFGARKRGAVRAQTGVVDLNGNTYPGILEPNCRTSPQKPIRYRGARGNRVDFSTPFAAAPEVAIALSYIDTRAADEHLRIMARVSRVDAHGFSYDFAVWCQTILWRAKASWIAMAQPARTPSSPCAPCAVSGCSLRGIFAPGRAVGNGGKLSIEGGRVMHRIFVMSFAILLGGCSAHWTSIARPFNPSDGNGRLIDAKQRAIIAAKRGVIGVNGIPKIGEDGKPVTVLNVCAEPSPDALQATASALGFKKSGREALEKLFSATAATGESVASIGLRTQTIQLLRDAYFRLCEAYMNDGIDSIAYDVLQRRFQNQIIALLAVEQLTGAVKAEQVALTTAAEAQADTQAELITKAIENTEKDLEKLQEEQVKNETKLAGLREKAKKLKAEKKAAEEKAKENEDENKVDKLQEEVKQATTNYDLNGTEIKAAERQQTNLKSEIERKQKLIEAFNQALLEAAKGTLKSSVRGAAVFTGGDNGASSSLTPAVVHAVRAITLNAINQDYEAQVCFETLRARNNVDQFKNEVNYVFDGGDSNREFETRSGGGAIFAKHCADLFAEQVNLRKARAQLVKAHANAVKGLFERVGESGNKIESEEVVNLLLALSQAVPTEPGVAFLARTFSIGRPLVEAIRTVPEQPTVEYEEPSVLPDDLY